MKSLPEKAKLYCGKSVPRAQYLLHADCMGQESCVKTFSGSRGSKNRASTPSAARAETRFMRQDPHADCRESKKGAPYHYDAPSLLFLFSQAMVYLTTAFTAASPSTLTTTTPAGAAIRASSEDTTVLATV